MFNRFDVSLLVPGMPIDESSLETKSPTEEGWLYLAVILGPVGLT